MKPVRGLPAHALAYRVQQGQKLRSMYRSLGWSRADCGNFLHVTERCLRKWAAGRHQMNFVTQGAMLGGSVRVGLEDSLYIGKGKLAKSNAEQVAKIKRIVEELSLEVATPDEARQILGTKGGDQVKF